MAKTTKDTDYHCVSRWLFFYDDFDSLIKNTYITGDGYYLNI